MRFALHFLTNKQTKNARVSEKRINVTRVPAVS